MKKETVVTFDGEDTFILPRNHSYNRRKGHAKFVGQDGTSDTDSTKKNVSVQSDAQKANPTPPPPAVTAPPAATQQRAAVIVEQPPSGVGDVTKPIDANLPPGGGQTGSGNTGSYTNYSVGKFSMPDPTTPNFCEIVQEFILTNGGGIASPPEITAARAAISKYCTNRPPQGGDPGTGTPKNEEPKDDVPADDMPGGSGRKGDIPKPELPKEPKAPSIVTVPVIENLGLPIGTLPVVLSGSQITSSGGGIGGGGGGEEEPPVIEEKKSYWWLLLVAAAVAGGIYYYRRRKK